MHIKKFPCQICGKEVEKLNLEVEDGKGNRKKYVYCSHGHRREHEEKLKSKSFNVIDIAYRK
jgi:rhodanese-related sulfurtransferase